MKILNFGNDFPGKMQKLRTRLNRGELTVAIYPQSANQILSIDAKVFRVASIYSGNSPKERCFIGKGNGTYFCEMQTATGDIHVCIARKNNNTYELSAGVVTASGGLTRYEDTRSGSVLLLTMMPEILAEEEANRAYQELQSYTMCTPEDDVWDNMNPTDEKEFTYAVATLCNSVYYRMTKADEVKAPLRISDNVKSLTFEEINKVKIDTFLKGEPQVFPKKEVKKEDNTQYKGKFSIRTSALSPEEESMVPTMAKWYVFPEWVKTVSKTVKLSGRFVQKFRNILLTGPSGTGKTKGTQAMASCLGLPYSKVTCSPDSEIFDFIGQMLPNTKKYGEKSVSEVQSLLNIPTFEDVENDFEATFEKLFNRKPGRMDLPTDCYSEISKRMLETKGEDADFTYVKSDLIKAVENGWFCEVQEPTVIKRSSVLVGLNAIFENDEDTAFFTLPTGEIIRRHPDCVICLTTNSDYEGCNMIQQSVLSRMDIVREIGNPTASELKDRVLAQTGFDNEPLLLKMSQMIGDINVFCQEKDITDGICGPRELTNWAKMAMLMAEIEKAKKTENKHVIAAAFTTLISKVSQSKEDMEDVLTGIIQKEFPMGDIENARADYMEGVI